MEIEAKIKITKEDADRIRQHMMSHDKTARTLLETNTYYDHDGQLTAQDKALRIRHETDNATGKSKSVLTFKGPTQPGPFKVREEHETTVEDGKVLADIFVGLGYQPSFVFQKLREQFDCGDVIICLDHVPSDDIFLEVEAPDELILAVTLRELGVNEKESIKQGYPKLLSDFALANANLFPDPQRVIFGPK